MNNVLSLSFALPGNPTKSTSKVPVKRATPSKACSEKPLKLKPKEMDILKAIGKLHAGHVENKTRDTVAILAKQKGTPEGYKKTLGMLKKANFIVYSGSDSVDLTPNGLDAIGYSKPLNNNAFHEEVIKELITPKAWEIFQHLLDRKTRNIEETAKALGYDMNKLSGYQKNLSKMSTLGYLEKSQTTMKLTDKCFPCMN